MKLSVIIVNYRGWKRLRPCLESLRCLNESSFSWEVLVVDNQSNDGQLSSFIQEFPEYTFTENMGNYGFAHGCNTGANASTADYLLFLNPDTIINLSAIEQLLRVADEHPVISVLSCTQINDRGKDTKPYGLSLKPTTLTSLLRSVYKIFQKPLVEQTLAHGVKTIFPEWVSGSLILISREKFYSLNKWDEDFWMYYEDADLCKRVRNAGGAIALLTSVKIIHNHGGASRVNAEVKALTKAEVMVSKHVYVHKHFRGFTRGWMHSWLVVNNLLLGPLCMAIVGLLLWFMPALRAYTKRYSKMVKYYSSAWAANTWLSPRSINYKNTHPS